MPDLRGAGPGHERVRIEDRGAKAAEIAGRHHRFLGGCRNGGNGFSGLADANALVVGEEERPVAADRTADRSAEFVSAEWLLRSSSPVVEERVGIQLVIPQELVGAAVKLIAAGFGLHDGDRARSRSILGRVVAGHHAHFLDRIDGGNHHDAVHPQTPVEQAIDEVAVVVGIRSVDANLRIGPQRIRAARRQPGLSGDGAGAELKQLDERSPVERSLENALVIDQGGDSSRLRLQQGCFAFHLDRFADVADRKLQVKRQRVGGGQLDSRTHQLLEAGMFHGRRDPAGRERVRGVPAAFVRQDHPGRVRAFVYQGDLCSRHDCARLIAHHANDGSAFSLAEKPGCGKY